MPRVALQTLCSYARYLGVSTVHTVKIHIFESNSYQHRNYSYDIIVDFFIQHTFQDLAGYPRILRIVV
jgi:hypothetical protein